MPERGPTLRSALCGLSETAVLRRQIADPRRPVGGRGTHARPVARATACPEQVVTAAAHEERAAPIGVVASVGDVLAGDPDRVAIDGRCSVVAPAGADRGREPRLLVAGEAVVG